MLNVIEKAVIKITQEMEKNRKAYCEAEESYGDTGYDQYWNKMQRLDKEYSELKSFIGLDKVDELEKIENEKINLYAENKQLKHFILEAKSMIDYIKADYWSDQQVMRLYEKFKDFN